MCVCVCFLSFFGHTLLKKRRGGGKKKIILPFLSTYQEILGGWVGTVWTFSWEMQREREREGVAKGRKSGYWEPVSQK